MARPGVMLYFSVLPALDSLPAASAGALLLAAMHYAQDGQEPVFEDATLAFAWAILKPSIDRDGEVYDEKQLRGEWMTYCRQCKHDGNEAVDFETWRQRTVTEPLRTDTDTQPISTSNPVSISMSVSDSVPMSVSKPNKGKGADKPPSPPTVNFGPELTAAFNDWLAYKKEKRQAYKPKGLQSLAVQVEKQVEVYGESAVAALIVECMSNGWQGIIWDKLEKQQPRNGEPGRNFQSARKSWAELAREMEAAKHDP